VQEDLELTPPRAKDKKKSKLNCRTIPDPNRSLHIDNEFSPNRTPPREFNQRIAGCGLEGREKNVLKNFDFIESDNFK